MGILQKAKKLEKLRQEIEGSALALGRIGDMLERYQPPEEESEKITREIEDHHSNKDRKNRELKKLVDQYSKEEPQIIDIWLSCHEEVCKRILKETEQDHRDYSIRHNLAEEILEYLDELKLGKRYKFTVNNFYLDDYYEKLILE